MFNATRIAKGPQPATGMRTTNWVIGRIRETHITTYTYKDLQNLYTYGLINN